MKEEYKSMDIFNRNTDPIEEDEEIDKEFQVEPGVKLWFFGRFLHFLKLLFKLIF